MQTEDQPINSPNGTTIKLYGYAMSPDHKTFKVTEDIRQKSSMGSVLMYRNLIASFPATKAGEREATAFVLDLNEKEVARLRASKSN